MVVARPPESFAGYVSPRSGRPLALDPGRRAFTTDDGHEAFACVADAIPDFRLDGAPLSTEEVRIVQTRLDGLWREAGAGAEIPQVITPGTPDEAARYWRTLARHELTQFVKWSLRGRPPYTQEDSRTLYRTLTDVYPGALRRPVHVLADGRPARCPLMVFKRASLEPVMRIIRAEGIRSVLDFGCGWGANTLLLKREFPELTVWSFDYSPQRVISTRFNLERLHLPTAELFVADGRRLPLDDGSIDLVFTTHVLEQMGEVLPRALAEIRRVARRFAVHVEPTWRWARWPHRLHMRRLGYPRDIAERAVALGWKLLDHRPADPAWGRAPGELIVLERG